jgi:hypothetical protein
MADAITPSRLAQWMDYTYPQVTASLRPWKNNSWKQLEEDEWREHEDSNTNFGVDAGMKMCSWYKFVPSITDH